MSEEKETKKEEKPGFIKAREKDVQREQEELAKSFSVRERLMRRQKFNTVNIELEDDLGKFTIKCRLFTEKEQRELMKLQEKLGQTTDVKTYDELTSKIHEILAYPKGICLDADLNVEFWRSGEFSNDLTLLLIAKVSAKARAVMADIGSFRQE